MRRVAVMQGGSRMFEPEQRTRFLRFVLIGALNTAVGYGLYVAFVLLSLHPQVALALQFAIGVVWNYTMHARFVFESKGYGKLLAYSAVYVGVYVFNAIGLDALMTLGFGAILAQLILLPVVVLTTFILLSLVFGPGNRSGDDVP